MSERRWHVRVPLPRLKPELSPLFLVVPVVPLLVLVAAVLAGYLLVALLGDRGGPAATDYRFQQIEYRNRLAENRAALIPGTLRYPSRVGVDAGEPATLDVRLELGVPAVSGEADGSPRVEEVPAGGIVGARLAGDGEVAITSQSPERQPVAIPGDEGRWRFAVTVPDPGERELALTLVTYLGATDEPLATSGPYVVQVDAHATLGYRLRQAGGAVTALLAFAGVSGGVAVTWLWRHLRRRRATAASPKPAPETESPEQPGVD